jgi:periplasmic copper chaperone A
MNDRFARAVVAGFVAGVVLTGCGGASIDQLTVSAAWARPTPEGATNGVVYFTIASPVDDSITDVEVSADIAGAATVHDSVEGGADGDHESHGGGGGAVTMTEAGRVDVGAGDTVTFEPGGLHVMLTELPDRLVEGDRFPITIVMDRAGRVDIEVVVADNPP